MRLDEPAIGTNALSAAQISAHFNAATTKMRVSTRQSPATGRRVVGILLTLKP
jgi:hypothetical protein